MRFTRNTRVFAFAACIAASPWAGSTATAANLLFQSGFEPGTTLGAITSGHQSITGTDNSTNFNWSSFPFEDATAVQLHIEGNASDFFNKLDTSQAHSGAQSLLLDISGYPAGTCCEQVPLQSSANTNPAKTVYYRLWMMLPNSEYNFLQGNNSFYYHMGTEWKTNDDFREQLSFNTTVDHHSLHPHMQQDNGGINCSNNSSNACNYIDPITGATVHDQSSSRHWVDIDNNSVNIPFGQWFEVETYFKRSLGNDGEYDIAINGQTVGHTVGANYGNLLEEIHDMYWVNLYNSQGNGSEWIDDLEVWDAPPCGTFPCGTGKTTSYTGAIPPFITSRAGAVGEVGMNFSFQVTALGSPTNYSISGSLPPGLSINSATGLISGTPTQAGTYTFNVEATNSTGKGAGWLEIQINGAATAPPTISSFSASSSTINAGQWVRLRWTQNRAATLSIDQGIGDVTGADPYSVQPSATTTYTLTATNAAGVVRASVTVNVNGTASSAPVITSPTSASGTVGSTFNYQIAATNSPTRYGASPLPAGLSVNTSTGLISGTPTAAGTANVTMSAANSAGSGSATLAITSGQSGAASIAQVQSNSKEGSGVTSISAAFPGANSTGNMILAFVRASTTSQTVAVSDSLGNSYTHAVGQNQTTDGHQIHFFYAKNVKAGNNTVTATFSATNNHPYIAVYEYSGLNTSSPLDQIASAQGSGASPSCGPTPTTTSANELAIGGLGMLNNFTGTATAGSGWTMLKQDTSTSRAANESEILSTTGAVTAPFTLSANTNWSCIVVTFKP